MKALVISEDKELVKFYTDIFKENKIDVINYNWLLKAMDNVEEIKPDFIVVNSVEYPRHWKTLVQYVNSEIFIGPTFFILQVNNNFTDDERRKAECLGINSIVSSYSDYFKKKLISQTKDFIEALPYAPCPQTREDLPVEDKINESQTIENESPVNEVEINESETEENTSDDQLFSVDMIVNKAKKKAAECPGSYLLTNPITGKVIYGKYLEYDGRKITCKIDKPEDFSGIECKTFIKYITFCNKKECKSFSANVNEYLDLADQKFLVLDICDFYEEK